VYILFFPYNTKLSPDPPDEHQSKKLNTHPNPLNTHTQTPQHSPTLPNYLS